MKKVKKVSRLTGLANRLVEDSDDSSEMNSEEEESVS